MNYGNIVIAVFLGIGAYLNMKSGCKGLKQKKARFSYPGSPKIFPQFLYGTPAIVLSMLELFLSVACLAGAMYFIVSLDK